MDINSIYKSHGAELYKNLLLLTKDNTEAVANDDKLSPSEIDDISEYVINEFSRSTDLMGTAINFYEPGDVFLSHVVNVAIFSLKMAIDMNLSKKDIQETVTASLLHDIGFGKIEEFLRDKEHDENMITEEDRELVRTHSYHGYKAITPENERDKRIAEIILQHHERADGSGYPNGLKESQQQPLARIISIADVYEALIHPRVFRDALAPPKGLEIIVSQKGSEFSAQMRRALVESLSIYPIGQFVLLNNGFIGKVIKTYKDNPVRPDVQLYLDQSGSKLKKQRIVKLKEESMLVIKKCIPGFKK
jgi:HD-GYP domain-containing protein (c-di-GMP phosphodiesterase class II)